MSKKLIVRLTSIHKIHTCLRGLWEYISFVLFPRSQVQSNLHLWPHLHNGHLSTTATLFCLAGQSIHWLLFKPLYNAHLIFLSPHRVSSFLAWGDFHSRFARSTIPEEKWGTTRSLLLQRPLSSVPKKSVVERFNSNFNISKMDY